MPIYHFYPFFFLMIRRPPRSTLFPSRRSSDLPGKTHTEDASDQRQSEAFRQELLEELRDRKSTRLNSSHTVISYAVFCLKKKKKAIQQGAPGDQEVEVPLH